MRNYFVTKAVGKNMSFPFFLNFRPFQKNKIKINLATARVSDRAQKNRQGSDICTLC